MWTVAMAIFVDKTKLYCIVSEIVLSENINCQLIGWQFGLADGTHIGIMLKKWQQSMHWITATS